MNLDPQWNGSHIQLPAVSFSPEGQQWRQSLVKDLLLMVRVGLLEFRRAKGLLGDPATSGSNLDNLLRESILALTGEGVIPSWFDSCQRWRRSVATSPANNPLKRLVDIYQLNLPHVFVLGLLGEVESHYRVNLMIAAMQQPAQAARPGVHLLLAMLEQLFPVSEFQSGQPLAAQLLCEHPLVRDQWFLLPGQEPLPLRSLQLNSPVWSVLTRMQTCWPGCESLPAGATHDLPESLRQQIPALAQMLAAPEANGVAGVVVRSLPHRGAVLFAAHIAQALGMQAIAIPWEIWQATPVLRSLCKCAGWLPVITPQLGPGDVMRLPAQALPHPLLVILGSDGALDSEASRSESGFMEINLPLPSCAERKHAWVTHCHGLPQEERESISEHLAGNALLGLGAIARVAKQAAQMARLAGTGINLSLIASARRQLDAEKLRLLAQPVLRDVDEHQLVMPGQVHQALNNLICRAHLRESLWDSLGRTAKITQTTGVRALFVGESGTGKTLAASYIATALGAPLYRVDLAAVMNKYIGESEKNLGQLLDYAAASDVVLLFDEADALFGARSDGQETGDRFANMLTNFLLTRIENHPGVVILTTNSRQRIDNAFSRRIDHVVDFPLPGYAERLALWRNHLGSAFEDMDMCQHLASHADLAGGQVRNAVLSAAVVAAGGEITPLHLITGIDIEYQKLGRSLPTKLQSLSLHLTACKNSLRQDAP